MNITCDGKQGKQGKQPAIPRTVEFMRGGGGETETAQHIKIKLRNDMMGCNI